MRGFLLAVACLATLATSLAVDEECVQRKVRGLPVHWPNPTDCSSFYRCTNKNIKRELLCPEGKEYNPRTGRCSSKGNNLCQLSLIAPLAETTNPCTNEISGAFVADVKSCRGFNICNNNLAYPQTCAAGSYFNAEVSACEPDTQSLCWENLCVKKANGVYVADANDCHSFYICYDEKPASQTCPEGSYFNGESLNCLPGKCPSEGSITTPATTTDETTCTEETTTCAPETITTTCTEATTTCVPETTTTTCTEATTTCAPKTTTTTCAAVTITTTCAADTTTTTCAAETITLSQATTTCTPEETTTPASDDDDCSNTNCDGSKCQNAKDGFIFPAQNTNAGFCVCVKQKPEYRACSDEAIFNESLQICVAQDKVCPSSKCLQQPDYTTFPASNTTNGFCRCLSGVASYFECAENDYVYSEVLGFCVKSSNSDDCEEETSTTPATILCEGGFKDGDFVPYPNNCMLFYICYEGELVESSCETGNYYDDTIKACLPDTEGKCPDCQVAQTSSRRNRRAVANCIDGVKIPAVDCDKYYKCVGGQKLLYGCGKNYFFNPITLSCDFDEQFTCWTSDTCVNGMMTAYPTDSKKYYECVDGKQVLKTCEAGSSFNKISMTCVAECTCPGGYTEGDISPHPKDCDKFYICVAGVQMVHECGKGNFFNKQTLSCEKDVKNTCNVEECATCPGGYKDGDLSAHPQDCDKFYICSDGVQVLQECGKGNYFDNDTLTCEPDIYDECWTKESCITCPGGYEDGEFSPHPTECNKYYICYNGSQVLEDCGTNNYFNKDSLMCEPDVYHVCWPNLCAGKPNGALVGNPQQCNSFFLCENEEAQPKNCLEGEYFDYTVGACQADVKAVCYNPCENENAGPVLLLPHPVCNMYYFCNDGKTNVGTCQVGSFDSETGVCNEAKKCYPNPCENPQNPGIFADPIDPAKFFICVKGMPVSKQCQAGAEFDPIFKMCAKVSDPDCAICDKDGTFPTLDQGNDSEFCVCVKGKATKIECPQEYTFNSELGVCYSNAPCDPSYCLENDGYIPYQNRNDSKSFCMCIDQKPVIIACPNNGTFNPYISKCSENEISPECLQSECVGATTEGKVFNPINTKTSNGICVCIQQIATFRPCSLGSSLNPALTICQLAEINCNSYQCRGLPDKTKIPAQTTIYGYCECVADIATYHNCPDNGEFSGTTNKCEIPICDLTKCTSPSDRLPAANTVDGYCDCKNNVGYVACGKDLKFSLDFKFCTEPCFAKLCEGKPNNYLIPSKINDNSFCNCNAATGNVAPTFELCKPDNYIFDQAKQACVGNAKEFCAGVVCNGITETFPAVNIMTGFCLCTPANPAPMFRECLLGIFDPTTGSCIPTAKDVCDISLCAKATMDQPLTIPSKTSDIEFCYCSSPTDAMVVTCPTGKHYNHAKGMCVSKQLDNGSDNACPDDVEEGQKVADTTTCNKYSKCVDGIMVPETCPAGKYFNVESNDCIIDTQGVCDMSECTCLGAYYENEHLPHPINKHLYYVCKDGMLHEYKCPDRRIYSVTQKQCVSGIAAAPPKVKSQKRTIDFSNDHEFGCLENEKRSVPSNCSQYEICLEQAWQRKTCSNYRYYNPEQKKCLEPRDDFVCSYAKVTTLPICNASMEHKLYQAKTCQQYYRCLEGKWRLKSCGRQQYFNAKMGTCLPVPQDPEFQCSKINNKILEGLANQNTTCQHLSQRFYGKNCAMYLMCLDNDWWYQYCPAGMFYNQTLNYCVPDVEQQCPDVIKSHSTPNAEEFSQDACQQDGLLRPSALACNRYFVCLNGKWQMQHCAQKEFYDITHAKCSPDMEGVCSQLFVDCLPNEKRALPRNCSAYEQCSSDGKWLRLSCPQGEVYDDIIHECITNRGICSKHGLKRACRNEEIMVVNKNCSMFYYCSLDSWNLGSCLKGFMYLAEKQMCVAHTAEDNCKALTEKQLQASALRQESELCLGKPDGTSVAHPLDCSRYYICIQQSNSHEMQCSKGSYFEASLGYCRPNDGSCRLPLTGVCANASDESLVAHPTDCQAFYKCSSINGTELLNCPAGQYYHNYTQQCRIDHGECKKDLVAEKKCAGFAHGTRLAHEKYCNIYYACVKGLAIPVECPDNYQFNGILGKCVADVEHQCLDGQLIDGNISYSCGNLSDGSYLPDRKDCTRYYICSQGQALPKKCANSSYFDNELLLCVPDDGSCPFVNEDNGQQNPVVPDPLMCEGKHGYLMTDPFNCNNFYACIHNKLKHERCYSQHLFNTTTQQCQQKPLTETNTNGNTTALDLKLDAAKSQNPQCLDETTSITKLCSEMSEGTSLAEPGDCRRYITCKESEEEPVSQRCRNGESFDSLLGFCRQNDGTCLLENGQRVGECSGKHGQLARDLNNCRNYFVCINGQKIAQTCQPDEYFSKTQNMCLKDTQNVCATTQTPEEQVKQSCAGLSESVLYPYIYDSCRSYFQCIKGVAKIHKCADELYFDPLAIKCVKNKTECIMPTASLQRSPAFSQTFSQLCSNKKLEHPYANLDNECRSFYICHSNGDVSHELCPLGMMFSKELNVCTAENKTQCEVKKQGNNGKGMLM
ncbi:uncharacterized protein LOC135953342 [Calliphora vicina]|uniref:uncharacterized protein LOC135953342 n=1 Tax=Calliphora vicina TaxID=7373 RepID=UPI00325ABB56